MHTSIRFGVVCLWGPTLACDSKATSVAREFKLHARTTCKSAVKYESFSQYSHPANTLMSSSKHISSGFGSSRARRSIFADVVLIQSNNERVEITARRAPEGSAQACRYLQDPDENQERQISARSERSIRLWLALSCRSRQRNGG